jgi:hypothetical protein
VAPKGTFASESVKQALALRDNNNNYHLPLPNAGFMTINM